MVFITLSEAISEKFMGTKTPIKKFLGACKSRKPKKDLVSSAKFQNVNRFVRDFISVKYLEISQ